MSIEVVLPLRLLAGLSVQHPINSIKYNSPFKEEPLTAMHKSPLNTEQKYRDKAVVMKYIKWFPLWLVPHLKVVFISVGILHLCKTSHKMTWLIIEMTDDHDLPRDQFSQLFFIFLTFAF